MSEQLHHDEEGVAPTETMYMDTNPPEQPKLSKRIWRAISALRPGGRRHYREKATPFSVNPNPRKYHRAEWRKRRKQIKNLMHRGEWPGRKKSTKADQR